jgi:hypothetical protein
VDQVAAPSEKRRGNLVDLSQVPAPGSAMNRILNIRVERASPQD